MQESNQQTFEDQNINSFIQKKSQDSLLIKLSHLFEHSAKKETTCECLMILDNDFSMDILRILQPKCQRIILVDGGANRIYKSPFRDSSKINCIVGDFDGVQQQVLKYYTAKGVIAQKDHSQDTTDFQKTINYCSINNIKQIICLNFFPGRLDHVLAAMNNTEKYLKNHPQSHIILIGLTNLMIYLHEKVNYTLEVDSQMIQKLGCGMVTFGKVEHVKTNGFKWNMGGNDQLSCLEWGNFLSTSNQMVSDRIEIASSEGLFFICQMRSSGK